MKKKHLLYGFLPIVALTLSVAGTAYAAPKQMPKNNAFASVATAIATKFNLNVSDVQNVIDQTVAAGRQQVEKNRPARIDPLVQAVKNGRLTQAQADLITAKRAELKTDLDALKNTAPVDRLAVLKTQAAALKQWATNNGIPPQYIMIYGGHGLRAPLKSGFNKKTPSSPALPAPTN